MYKGWCNQHYLRWKVKGLQLSLPPSVGNPMSDPFVSSRLSRRGHLVTCALWLHGRREGTWSTMWLPQILVSLSGTSVQALHHPHFLPGAVDVGPHHMLAPLLVLVFYAKVHGVGLTARWLGQDRTWHRVVSKLCSGASNGRCDCSWTAEDCL